MNGPRKKPPYESHDLDDWDDEFNESDLGPTGHGDICMSDADPGL